MTERDLNRGSGLNPGSTTTPGMQPVQQTSSPTSSSVQSAASAAGASASASAHQAAAGLKDKVNEDWQSAKSTAQAEIGNATQRAKDAADDQKNFAAERVSGIAAAIEKVGDELAQGDQPEVGRYAKQIGSSVHRFADDIKGKDMGQIAGMAEDFGRRQPAAFIGLAALAGFAASRFLTASAERGGSSTQGSASTSAGTRTGMGTGASTGMGSGATRNAAPAPTAPTPSTSPVRPATGAGYPTGYSPEGTRNG
ncbi:MAG: nutrient deprivation-induced protein [Pseudorhizobium sp.]